MPVKKGSKRGKMAAENVPVTEPESTKEITESKVEPSVDSTFVISSKEANDDHEDMLEPVMEKDENASDEEEAVVEAKAGLKKKGGRPTKQGKKKEGSPPIAQENGDGDAASPNRKRASDEIAVEPQPKRGRKKVPVAPKKIAAPKKGRKMKETEGEDVDSNEEPTNGEVDSANDDIQTSVEMKEGNEDEEEEKEPSTSVPKTKASRKVRVKSPKDDDGEDEQEFEQKSEEQRSKREEPVVEDDAEEAAEPKPKGQRGKTAITKSKAAPAPSQRPTRARKANVNYAEIAEDVDTEEKKPKKTAAPKKGRPAKKDEDADTLEVPAKKKPAGKKGRPKKEVAEVEEDSAPELEAEEN